MMPRRSTKPILKDEDKEVGLRPKTTWMRPPQGTATDEGLMPGDPGYVDPHAEVMKEWEDIDKNPMTGGFRPDGTVILHSDPDSAHSLNLLNNANSSASTEAGGYGKKRKAEISRGQMNLTGSKGSSILTS